MFLASAGSRLKLIVLVASKEVLSVSITVNDRLNLMLQIQPVFGVFARITNDEFSSLI